jgi:hypothetical protein
MEQQTEKARFSPVLDLDYYRSVNSDVRSLSDDELMGHFDRWGKIEGSAGSPLSFREHFLSIISQTLGYIRNRTINWILVHRGLSRDPKPSGRPP